MKQKPGEKERKRQGEALQEMRQQSPEQRRQTREQLPPTPGGMGVRAADELLTWLEAEIPVLDEEQRVMLLTGEGLRMANSPEAIELRSVLEAWWLKAEDRDAADRKLAVLQFQGQLPPSSVGLLRSLRKWMKAELERQQLPRLQVVEWSAEQVRRQGAEGIELEERTLRMANAALGAYRDRMKVDDPLVFGQLALSEARLWLSCAEWVKRGKLRGVDVERESMEQLQLRVVKLMSKCRRYGVESPAHLQQRMDEKLGRWNGNPVSLGKDSQGQWRYGDGAAAEWATGTKYEEGKPVPTEILRRQKIGYSGVFEDKDWQEVLMEIQRVQSLESGLAVKSHDDEQSNESSGLPEGASDIEEPGMED